MEAGVGGRTVGCGGRSAREEGGHGDVEFFGYGQHPLVVHPALRIFTVQEAHRSRIALERRVRKCVYLTSHIQTQQVSPSN